MYIVPEFNRPVTFGLPQSFLNILYVVHYASNGMYLQPDLLFINFYHVRGC